MCRGLKAQRHTVCRCFLLLYFAPGLACARLLLVPCVGKPRWLQLGLWLNQRAEQVCGWLLGLVPRALTSCTLKLLELQTQALLQSPPQPYLPPKISGFPQGQCPGLCWCGWMLLGWVSIPSEMQQQVARGTSHTPQR